MIIDVIALCLTRIFIMFLICFSLVMFMYFISTVWCYYIEDPIPSKEMVQSVTNKEDIE